MGKGRVTFFGGACNFYIKSNLKSGIFNDKKKFINKNVFLRKKIWIISHPAAHVYFNQPVNSVCNCEWQFF